MNKFTLFRHREEEEYAASLDLRSDSGLFSANSNPKIFQNKRYRNKHYSIDSQKYELHNSKPQIIENDQKTPENAPKSVYEVKAAKLINPIDVPFPDTILPSKIVS